MSSKSCEPLIVAALALLTPWAASAQVNRCTDSKGRVSYADGDCEAMGLRRDAGASRRLSGIVMAHYDVHGLDGKSLIDDLAKRGPSGFHGMTNWRYNYRYRYGPAGSGCRVTSVTTEVTGRILMPRWVDEPRAPQSLRDTWSRYMTALMVHEEGHMATGQALMRALQSDLGALWAPSCQQLASVVDRTANVLIDQYNARDRDYDRDTRHGATQGAFLDVP